MDIKFIIYYNGIREVPDEITFDLTNLKGGRIGTSPIGTSSILRDYSETRLLFDSVPYDFLYIPSE